MPELFRFFPNDINVSRTLRDARRRTRGLPLDRDFAFVEKLFVSGASDVFQIQIFFLRLDGFKQSSIQTTSGSSQFKYDADGVFRLGWNKVFDMNLFVNGSEWESLGRSHEFVTTKAIQAAQIENCRVR